MSEQPRQNIPTYGALASGVEGMDSLVELALNMRWSWNHATDALWRDLSRLWDLTHNPWAVLQTVSRDKIERIMADPAFRARVDELVDARRKASASRTWFQAAHPGSPLTCVAYFSMEFMLSEALPIYSGGLGNVAGDQLKAANDLGVPVVGVGLLYQQGYFRQALDKDGAQQALYPYNDPGQLTIEPLRQENGEWLRLEVAFPGYSVWLRAWQAQVGRVRLLLLDSNDPANVPSFRAITSQLYGGGPEMRLRQELILGIGGWRLLTALGLRPEVCHLNEGHAAFAVLERAHGHMRATGQSFETALAVTRAGNIFTTHTAVAAGFDRFAPDLMERYLGSYAEQQLGVGFNDLLSLGRRRPDDACESFNMAYLAIRGSGAVNGVSRVHGQVSRELFQPLFPRRPTFEVPVGYVTNGVHMPTWDSAPADDLWTEACGKDRWRGPTDDLTEKIRAVSDARMWRLRNESAEQFVAFTRERLAFQFAVSGASSAAIKSAKGRFDPNALTLGFARRFATYKRPNLLLRDPDRLLRLLSDPERPVQLVIAGKAHPADQGGQALIQEWLRFIDRPEVRLHVVFLSDYDMLLSERLVQGVDVWINTPRRPWEACGTSGMKALVNGGINLSELDGWWAEAYAPEVGWALGDGKEHGDDPAVDAAEAEALYDLLEHEVISEFYERDRNGIPARWVNRMRESMALLTPRFSAGRAVREYVEERYLPAAAEYRRRSADNESVGQRIVEWRRGLNRNWGAVHFAEVKVETRNDQHEFEVRVCLGDLDPGAVRVELYADGVDGVDPIIRELKRIPQQPGTSGGTVYGGSVTSSRPATDYTPRLIPYFEGVAVPLEEQRILWQR